jgi:DnaJ-class molecular chaperone
LDHTPSACEILDLRDGAPPKEVRAAYYKLIKELHPDVHANKSPEERARMEDRAKVVTGAYNALKT